VDSTIAAVRAGKRAPLIVAPCGFGKTRTGVELLARTSAKGNAGLWLSPRLELIDQTVESLRRNGCERVSVLRGDDSRIAPQARIVVATPQTLLAREQRPPARVVVFDEARHYLSQEWGAIGDSYRDAIRVGLDATPQRQDGTAMGNLFDALIVGAQPRQLIELGLLVPVRVVGPTSRTTHLAEDPVQAYLTLAKGRRAVVFCGSVAAARKQAERFEAMGIRAACVDGKMPEHKRAVHLERFATGAIQILTNVFVLCEGWDCPPCDCAIFARGFTVEGAMIQAAGRVMRPHPGKRDALIVDLQGCCHQLGLPDEDREYSLEGKAIKSSESLEAIRQCPQCGRVQRAALYVDAQCPSCGFMLPRKMDPRVKREMLEQINSSHPDTRRTEKLRDIIRTAQAKGHRLGWALIQYKVRYGHWPTDEIKRNAGFFEAQASSRRTGT
jgi:superfamily II DNA or RNA helicase